MKTSPALIAIAAALAFGPALAACAGGSADTAPAQAPGEHAPLPPLASSPLSELVDHQEQLHLTPDQVQKIQALDRQLTAANLPLERQVVDAQEANEQRSAQAVAASADDDKDDKKKKKQERPDHTVPGPDEAAGSGQVRAARARISHNRAQSLSQALCLLAPDQRSQARRLLFDTGYSVPDQSDCSAPPPTAPAEIGTAAPAATAPAATAPGATPTAPAQSAPTAPAAPPSPAPSPAPTP